MVKRIKIFLSLFCLLFLTGNIHSQNEEIKPQEFFKNPAYFLSQPNVEIDNLFKLSDLTLLRLKSLTPLIAFEDSTKIQAFLLVFDYLPSDSTDVDLYIAIENYSINNDPNDGKILELVFVHTNGRFFTRYFPHEPNLFYMFESGRFDRLVFDNYMMKNPFKINKILRNKNKESK